MNVVVLFVEISFLLTHIVFHIFLDQFDRFDFRTKWNAKCNIWHISRSTTDRATMRTQRSVVDSSDLMGGKPRWGCNMASAYRQQPRSLVYPFDWNDFSWHPPPARTDWQFVCTARFNGQGMSLMKIANVKKEDMMVYWDVCIQGSCQWVLFQKKPGVLAWLQDGKGAEETLLACVCVLVAYGIYICMRDSRVRWVWGTKGARYQRLAKYQ